MTNDGEPGGDKGRMVGGRYRLLERIGSGVTGTVWRAHDEVDECEVAVKRPHLPDDPEDEAHRRAAHRLYREARAAARVDHPSAVSIHDVVMEEDEGRQDGLPWIVMESVRGESLHEALRRGPLPPPEAARIGLAVLGALRAAHAVGIVHRDVKPTNVLLAPNNRVVLTDFGIADVHGEEPAGRGSEGLPVGGGKGASTVGGVQGASTAGGEELLAAQDEFVPVGGEGPSVVLGEESRVAQGEAVPAGVGEGTPVDRAEQLPTAQTDFVASSEFVAPERMDGLGAAGPASDLWSLGALLYAAVEGRSPFRRTAPQDTFDAEPPQPPEPKQAGPLGPLLVRLLERDPERRPSATEVAVALEAVAEGRTPPDPGTLELGPDTAPSSEPPRPARPPEQAATPPSGPPTPGAAPTPGPPTPDTAPTPARSRRTVPLTFLTLVLAGGAWLGTSFLGEPDSGASTERTGNTSTPASTAASAPASTAAPAPASSPASTSTPAPAATPAAAPWIAHREPAMDAVLSLPSGFREAARQGSSGGGPQPRLVVYSAGSVAVRLTQWDQAPASPAERAAQARETWSGAEGGARTLTTDTSFRGDDAVLADTARGPADRPTRVVELFVLTDDRRMYELRVDMPKGTPDERRGMEVFETARDRLRIGAP